MSLRWLSSMVGGNRIARPGIRRKMAPQAHRDLAAEIDVDLVSVLRVWLREIVRDASAPESTERAVVVQVEAEARADVGAWLGGADDDEPEVRTDWIFLPQAPEVVLIGVVERADQEGGFRFNLRFPADRYRRHLETIARSGLLGLTTEPLQLGPERRIESPCVFVPIQTKPLRDFLRELPAVPVV